MKKENWKIVFKVIVGVLTALATALGINSCR